MICDACKKPLLDGWVYYVCAGNEEWLTCFKCMKEIEGKDPIARDYGTRGGLKGGVARALKLSPQRRKEIAKKAALARWRKS